MILLLNHVINYFTLAHMGFEYKPVIGYFTLTSMET